jgi:hypothetical protein
MWELALPMCVSPKPYTCTSWHQLNAIICHTAGYTSTHDGGCTVVSPAAQDSA